MAKEADPVLDLIDVLHRLRLSDIETMDETTLKAISALILNWQAPTPLSSLLGGRPDARRSVRSREVLTRRRPGLLAPVATQRLPHRCVLGTDILNPSTME